jgi:glycosyltransferase involved in cell wall biosynthesis
MRPPAFTVVLSAFNEEDWIADAIGSVLGQTMEDFELIVVDDGSTDGTAAVVTGFADPRVRLIRQENSGLAAALNVGIGAGEAPYAALIDADDLWMPGYLEGMLAALQSAEGVGFAYTDAWVLDHQRSRFWRQSSNEHMDEPTDLPSDPTEFLRLLLRRNFVFGLGAMNREAFQAIGGFDGTLRAAEDYELWMRFLVRGYRGARAPGRLAIVRDRRGAMHTDEAAMLRNVGQVFESIAAEPELPTELRPLVAARIAEIQATADRLGGRGQAGVKAVRRRLGVIKRATVGRDFWYPGTPPEVAAAFPDLKLAD